MLRTAVIGCGRIGQMHAENILIHPETTLAGVYDISLQASKDLAIKCNCYRFENVDSIFLSDQVDAIIVASSTSTHADYIEKAVKNNKPVLCEKPIDLDLRRINQTAEKIKNSTVQVQIGFNRRFDPGHQASREALLAGRIGNLYQVIITSRDPEMPPKTYYENAGGLFRDMTIHDFDLARFMLNDEPVAVFAMAEGLIDPNMMKGLSDHDTAMIFLTTKDGKQCCINNSRSAVYGYDQRVELLGSNGMIQSNNKKPHEMRIFDKNSTETSEPYEYFFLERYSESFMGEISEFVKSVREGVSTKVGFEDGRKALILAEAAYLSLNESRLVKVSEITDKYNIEIS